MGPYDNPMSSIRPGGAQSANVYDYDLDIFNTQREGIIHRA